MSDSTGFTIWLTGLPCFGKSTLAQMPHQRLSGCGRRTVVFDGDEVRERLSKGQGYSKEDRDENVRRICYACNLVTQLGGIAIAAVISPYRSTRDEARTENGRFVEVYVKCDLNVCMERDVKGHYRRAIQGKIQNFTGISDPYEEPVNPEVIVESDRLSAEESLDHILDGLKDLDFLPAGAPALDREMI